MKFKSLVFSLLFGILYPAVCGAKEEPNPFLPLFIGQSGTGGASLQEDLSYIINPASLGFHKKSKLALHYSLQNQSHNAILSVLDLKTSIPIAVNYQRTWDKSFNKPEKSYWFFNSGFRLSSFASLGASVQKDLLSSDWNFNIGSLLKINSNLAIGLYMDKLLKEENKNLQSLSLAGYYRWKKFFLTQVDISRSHREWIVKASVQSLFHPLFALRLGGFTSMETWDWSTRDKQALSGALSFNSPKVNLEYGMQKNPSNYQHSLSLMIKI